MRQALIAAPHDVRLIEADLPGPAPGELLVRSRTVGICGSDLHALEGRHPFIDLPVVPGHEVCGVVEAVGGGAGEFAPGDRVLLEPNLVCGRCPYCRSGRYNLCDELVVVGCQTAGALADAFTAPARRFHRVPDALTDAAAALVEPLSTGTHAVRLAGALDGASVAILGAGSIGLLVMLAARAAGAGAIAITDPIAAKRERGLELGAAHAFDAAAPDAVERIRGALGGRPDFVFDCVAVQATIDQAIALTLKGATTIVVGVPVGPVSIPLPLLQDRELRLQGSAMYVREDVERALALVADGSVPVDALVTGTFALEQVADAFAEALSGAHVKVHVTPG